MNDFKKQHLEKKNLVVHCLEAAEKFLTEYGYHHEAEVMSIQRKNLEEGEFSIAVVGEFSAGKSTFLNALMGEKILPSFTSETTATINFLRHKDKAENGEEGKVYYNNGQEEVIPKADYATISKYVSTQSTAVDVAKMIRHLDLYLNSKFLEDNVTLVDTPGLNGVAEGHRELTEMQIEKSSAGIFLFDANQPGSKSDFAFLTELRKRVKSIIFVLNKIDNIKTSEGETVESVIAKLKKSYKEMYPDAETIPEIWPIAAYPALVARATVKMDYHDMDKFTQEEKAKFEKASRMKEFEDRLWKFLTQGEKAVNELQAPITQLIAQFKKIKDEREAELRVLSEAIDSSEIEAQQLELNKQVANLEEQLNIKTKDIKKDLRDAEKEFYEAINSACESCKKDLESFVDNFCDVEDIDAKNIEKKIKSKLSKISQMTYADYCDAVETIQLNYSNEITDELNNTLSQELNVKLNNQLELSESSIGLEHFEKGMEELKSEIQRLQEEAEKKDDILTYAMEQMERKKELEKKLENKQELIEFYRANFVEGMPDVKTKYKDQEVVIKRRGILGGIAAVLVGDRHEMRPVEVYDSSDRELYIKQKQEIIDRHDRDIQKYQEELDKLSSVDIRTAEKIANRKLQALSEKREELRKYESDFAEKVKKQGELQLRRQKKEINSYIDTLSDDFMKQCKESFRKNREAQLQLILELIGHSITEQIELKKKELEILSNRSKQAVSERTERINQINTQKSAIKEIMENALKIESDINSIKIDVIAEEKL